MITFHTVQKLPEMLVSFASAACCRALQKAKPAMAPCHWCIKYEKKIHTLLVVGHVTGEIRWNYHPWVCSDDDCRVLPSSFRVFEDGHRSNGRAWPRLRIAGLWALLFATWQVFADSLRIMRCLYYCVVCLEVLKRLKMEFPPLLYKRHDASCDISFFFILSPQIILILQYNTEQGQVYWVN